MSAFKAIVVEKDEDGQTVAVRDFAEADLMDGDVTVRVTHSTLNYKDGLALTGKAPVVRRFPMIPGIDFAGIVETSSHPDFKPGDAVVLNGWGTRRDASRRLCREGARQGRLAGPAAARADAPRRRWRSARPATRRCSASWPSSGTACARATARRS